MTGVQVREARRLLGWPSVRLSLIADIPETAILLFETTGRMAPPQHQTAAEREAKLKATLEAAGVEFIDGKEPGVKLRATKA